MDEPAEAEVVLLPLSHFVSVHRSALPQATLYYRRSLLAAFTQLQLKVHFFLPLCLYLSHCSLSMQHSQVCPHTGCCRCCSMNPKLTPHTAETLTSAWTSGNSSLFCCSRLNESLIFCVLDWPSVTGNIPRWNIWLNVVWLKSPSGKNHVFVLVNMFYVLQLTASPK